MSGEYNFLERSGKYAVIVFLIWCVAYVLDRWVFKTHILVSCCSVVIAMFSAILFEFVVGFIFEVE
jgi:hypothetical protein